MNVEQIKEALVGDWQSIAPEIRPSASKNADGTPKPFYLKREFKYLAFKYLAGNRFELNIVNSADPNGALPLARVVIRGHMTWRGPHPIAANGYGKWQVNDTQSVFGKTFAPFGLSEGKNFMEFDLVYLSRDLLFWGARHVDGRGFDTEENRPTNLQIPLVRK